MCRLEASWFFRIQVFRIRDIASPQGRGNSSDFPVGLRQAGDKAEVSYVPIHRDSSH